MSSLSPVILWFRSDLRLADNPALAAASAGGRPVIPVYIHDDASAGAWKPGGASRWWLHESLSALAERIPLAVFEGDAESVLVKLVRKTGAAGVYWNRCYEPWAIARDTKIKKTLKQDGIIVESFNGSLLFEPWEILNGSGSSYKVFTPYSRACLVRPVRPADETRRKVSWQALESAKSVASLGLQPRIHWYGGMAKMWQPGEAGARKRLKTVIESIVEGYPQRRDYPAEDGTSRLSPHLRFGEISPHTVWHEIEAAPNSQALRRQLLWREFSWHMLYHFPELPEKPWNPRFAGFEWLKDKALLKRWQQGQTGYPIVDAGMRQLWQTGWMHNRVRMIVGSFLVKHLRLHWRLGEDWFWDTLVDADLGNNAAGWQWIAGCGADAAPYFRVFNPVLQSEKFDAGGDYIRVFVPELAKMPADYIHAPWEAPDDVLKKAGVLLGKHYPHPIVDHAKARALALKVYKDSANG